MSKATCRTLAILLFLFLGGALSSLTFAQGQPPQGRPAPASQVSSLPSPVSETRMGMWRGRPVTYQVINGRNIYQGDIILENVQPMPTVGGAHPASVGLVDSNYLWPVVNGFAQIPYVIDPASTNPNLNAAISIYNSTFAGVIQLVPRTTQANYIDINLNPNIANNGVCEATEGDAHQGEQFVTGAGNCTIATILHEFGHVTGVWHEQSRTDASTYVTFNYANVIKGSIGNFLPAVDNDQQNLGFYDYASIMEYPAFSFDRNGAPPLDSIPPGMPLSNSVGYSAADVEGIMRLYGVAPTEVTVTSNPPGLQVLVDSSPITTPMTFSWSLNSMHTLAVATGVQTVNGIIVDSSDPQEPTTFYYQYGRWNDGGAQSHTITVTPGNGDAGFPISAPQVATYTANFVQLVPYTPTVFPSGSGSVAATGVPSGPQSYPGVSGLYFVARQQATLTATANSGFSFYEFNNGPYWLAGGLGSNPKTFYVPDSGLTLNTGVEFTNTPVYTIDVTPNYFSSNLGVDVDGVTNFWPVPKNYSSMYDSTWTANSSHTLQFSTPLRPFSVNTQFVFSTWTPGGTANPLSITLPATSQSYIATINPEYVPATNFNPCGGTGAITPASTMGGFYPSGTMLTYTATPSPNSGGSPWIFTGWSWDLTGTTNPDTLSPTDESLVYASFNTTSAPLTITSLSPSSVSSGGSSFTLTINGTGFTQSGTGNPIENVGFNFPSIFLTPTFVSSTELQVTVPAADIATPGTLLLYVENFPSNWTGCAVFADQPFFVHQGPPSGATTVTATPGGLTFPSTVVDQPSASQPITVKNTGSTATTVAITASTNFGQTNSCPVAPSTLAAGATCTINATFAPTTAGNLTGNIAVTDSASNSPQLVTLSGTATPAPTTVTATPSSIAFGSEAYGTTTTSATTIAVQNTGTASTSIAIAASANYSQINNCGTLLQIGTSCTVTVSFTPTANGSLPGTISITDSAMNSPQTVTLSGTGTGAPTVTVTVTPATLTFTSQTVGTTSPSQPVTVKNTSTLSTTLSIGAATGDFAQTNTCSSTLAAGASCTVNVTFTPTTTGTRTGSISITDQATNSPQSVSLTGTGAAATITVTATPTSLSFGNEAVGMTSTSQPITVKNTGTGNTTVVIAASANFGQTNTCPASPATLNAGVSCTVNATFAPTATGSLTGTISVTDSASNSPQTISLSGTGLTTMTVTPSTLAFGNQNVGTTSASQPITVKNAGTASTSITVAASTNYSQTNNCTPTLAGGATCTINVTFAPTTGGSLPGTVTITDSAANSPQTVTLSGTGTTVIVTPSPASLTFPSQTVGTTSGSMSFTVTNTGTGSTPLTVGAATGDFAQTNACPTTLAASGGTCTVNVTFTPTTTGTRTGSIAITDQATNSPQTVSLSGTGASAGTVIVTVTPASETFAAQTVGTTSAAKIVTVKNTGTAASTSLSFGASGDFAAVAGGTTPCGTTLAGSGKSCTISVTFTPTTTGTLTGSVSVTDGATNSPQMVSLTGTGKAATVIVTPSPTSETFASQAVGTTSAAKVVTVKNTGTGSTPITISPATGDFAQTNTCGTTLGPSPASCTISVTFTPEAAGTLTGSISITDNATNSPQMLTLTGTGKAATVIVTPSPTTETFASQTVGITSAAKVVTVKNTGTGSTSISISASGDFAQTNTCGTTLGPSPASCTISVTFTPEAAGTLTGSISITDTATNSPQMVKLTGTGVAAVVVTATPTSETFAAQTVETTSAAKIVTIKNTGTASTSLSFAASGDFAAVAGGTTPCGTTLPGGKSCTISVTFTPTTTGTLTGSVSVTDSATNSPQKVSLTGTGKAPTVIVAATPTTETFASQAVGTTSAAKTVTIKNTGTGPTSLSFGTTGDFAETAGTCTGTLGPSPASCTVMVTFTPTATGSRAGTLTITDTATNSPQTVKLTGTGS